MCETKTCKKAFTVHVWANVEIVIENHFTSKLKSQPLNLLTVSLPLIKQLLTIQYYVFNLVCKGNSQD